MGGTALPRPGTSNALDSPSPSFEIIPIIYCSVMGGRMSLFIAFDGFYALTRVDGTDPPQFTITGAFSDFPIEMRESTNDPVQDGTAQPGDPVQISVPGDPDNSTEETYVGVLEGPGGIVGVITQFPGTEEYYLSTNDTTLTVGGTVAATESELVYCFLEGTRIATPAGEVAIETLQAGDLVLTAEGAAVPVRWVGRQTVATRFADPLRTLPVRIAAGALGEGLPRRDLLVSPSHALGLDGVLAEAAALVNGTTIARLRKAELPERFTYYHVELAAHALLLAEGAPAESFVDHVPRQRFDNAAEHAALHDGAPIKEMALPRACAARQVPPATRRRLAAIAARLEAPVAEAA